MKTNAVFQGRVVQIIDTHRVGSDLSVLYIDSPTGSGPLISTKLSTSALGADILVSTSATWVS